MLSLSSNIGLNLITINMCHFHPLLCRSKNLPKVEEKRSTVSFLNSELNIICLQLVPYDNFIICMLMHASSETFYDCCVSIAEKKCQDGARPSCVKYPSGPVLPIVQPCYCYTSENTIQLMEAMQASQNYVPLF